MKRYLYYPGCSLEGTAAEYDIATRALMQALDTELVEIDQWTCCGATAAHAVSPLLAGSLAARNLALAENMDQNCDLLVPCSACYLNLKKVGELAHADPIKLARINAVLTEESLYYTGRIRVRHLLDVLAVDFGAQQIAPRVVHPLRGVSVAPYYGCQCLRPYAVFDDPEIPRSMEPLLRAAGAKPLTWSMGAKCCGASHMSTTMNVGLTLSGAILSAAADADAIVTVCPMCQMNLEAFQKKISRKTGTKIDISVLYLPQLLGMALGLDQATVRLDLNLSVSEPFRCKLAGIQR